MGYKLLAWGSDPTLNTIPTDLAAVLDEVGAYASVTATTIGPNFAVNVDDSDTINKTWIWGPDTALHTIPADLGTLDLSAPMREGQMYINQGYGDGTVIYKTKDSDVFAPQFKVFGKNADAWELPTSFTTGEWRQIAFMYAYGSVVAAVNADSHSSGTQELYAFGSNSLINAVPTAPFNPSTGGSFIEGLAANGSVYVTQGYPLSTRSYAWGADDDINSAATGGVPVILASDTLFLFATTRAAEGASAAIKAVPSDVTANAITGPDYQRNAYPVGRSILAQVVVSGAPKTYAWGDSAGINAVSSTTLNDIISYALHPAGPNVMVAPGDVAGFAAYGESAIADNIPTPAQSYWYFHFYYAGDAANGGGSVVALAYDENNENPHLFAWGANTAVNAIPTINGELDSVKAVSATNVLISYYSDGPPPAFWVDYKNTEEDSSNHVLSKPPLRTLIPGTAFFPGQAASVTCPPTPPGTLPTPAGNGLHGCYTVYQLKNTKTGATASAMTPEGSGVPSQYNTQDWLVSSFSTVCYP